MCYVKEENWAKVKESCNEALELDNQNVKSLFRRGQVSILNCSVTQKTKLSKMIVADKCQDQKGHLGME